MEADELELIEELLGKKDTALGVIDCDDEAELLARGELTEHLLPLNVFQLPDVHRVDHHDERRRFITSLVLDC